MERETKKKGARDELKEVVADRSSFNLAKFLITTMTAVSVAVITTKLTSTLGGLALTFAVSSVSIVVGEIYRILFGTAKIGAKKAKSVVSKKSTDGSDLSEDLLDNNEDENEEEEKKKSFSEEIRETGLVTTVQNRTDSYLKTRDWAKFIVWFLIVAAITVLSIFVSTKIVESNSNPSTIENNRVQKGTVTEQYPLEVSPSKDPDIKNLKEENERLQKEISAINKRIESLESSSPAIESPTPQSPSPSSTQLPPVETKTTKPDSTRESREEAKSSGTSSKEIGQKKEEEKRLEERKAPSGSPSTPSYNENSKKKVDPKPAPSSSESISTPKPSVAKSSSPVPSATE